MAARRFVRVPARKARLVLDQIRGKSVGEALATLQFTPQGGGAAHREGAALGGRQRRAQPPGAQPRRPAGRQGDGRRRALAQARVAAGHGPRVLHQAPDEPSHHRAERRDAGASGRRAAARRPRGSHGTEDTSDRVPPRLHAHVELALVRDEGLRGPPARGREDPPLHQVSLYHAGISRIDIERSANRARITIFTARPGIIIGRKGAEVEKLKNEIQSAPTRRSTSTSRR